MLAVAPLPDYSPFTSHVSLQGLSLPPVCLSIFPLLSLCVRCWKVNSDRACWDAVEGLNFASV